MSNKISVTTSFYPIYFLTSQIGGDLIDVANLTPAGTEPHDYEPTAQDIIKIKKSRLLFLNGGGLEVWSDDIKKGIGISTPKIINLGDELINQQSKENSQDKKDPHIWLSPILAIKMAEKITASLVEVDSVNKDYYQSNFDILKTELINLDSDYKKGLANCLKNDIVTAHAAFGYLTQTYGINQISIAGLSPEEEPSIQQLAEVAKIAKENEIKYIFFESLTNPKLSQTIAREVGAQTLVLNPIEGLSENDLKQGKNYLTEMEKNLENLKIALECD
ncbi:MAG: Periplasmic solute binding protein [uncultured bacterium]|nr:MAG: Periplasmic solute binding protein [uncultured bacterium]